MKFLGTVYETCINGGYERILRELVANEEYQQDLIRVEWLGLSHFSSCQSSQPASSRRVTDTAAHANKPFFWFHLNAVRILNACQLPKLCLSARNITLKCFSPPRNITWGLVAGAEMASVFD